MSQTNSYVLVDLDSLLDTRLGTLAKLKPEKLMEYMLDPQYYRRVENVFEDVDYATFKEAFDKRDKETLKLSPPTKMMKEISEIVQDVLSESHIHPNRGIVKLVINTYPYKLTPEEKEAIALCMMYHTGETLPVETITLMPSMITPGMLVNEYHTLVMYDYGDWLESQAESLARIQIPDINLLAPVLWFNEKPSDEELVKEFGNPTAPLEAVELTVRGLVGLTLADVEYWCCEPPDPEILKAALDKELENSE